MNCVYACLMRQVCGSPAIQHGQWVGVWRKLIFQCGRAVALVAVLGIMSASVPALGTDYPSTTVRIVVPFPAGGVPDILARILAQGLSEKWKQPVVIENRSGANTAIGASFVARSSPD